MHAIPTCMHALSIHTMRVCMHLLHACMISLHNWHAYHTCMHIDRSKRSFMWSARIVGCLSNRFQNMLNFPWSHPSFIQTLCLRGVHRGLACAVMAERDHLVNPRTHSINPLNHTTHSLTHSIHLHTTHALTDSLTHPLSQPCKSIEKNETHLNTYAHTYTHARIHT